MVDQPLPDTTATATATSGGMSASEVLHLVTLFDNSLGKMEKRLLDTMKENSDGARERWKKHDEEAEAHRQDEIKRFVALETALLDVENVLKGHLKREHEEDLVNEARVKPLKMSLSWIWQQRKDILLFFIFLLATAAAVGEWMGRLLGLPPHAS